MFPESRLKRVKLYKSRGDDGNLLRYATSVCCKNMAMYVVRFAETFLFLNAGLLVCKVFCFSVLNLNDFGQVYNKVNICISVGKSARGYLII